MEKLKELLSIRENHVNHQTIIFYILVAFFFSVSVRVFLYYQISDYNDYFYDGSIIPIWNLDAGLYGFYANQLLNGTLYPLNAEYMPGHFIYWIVLLTGFSVDNVLFFAPAFFSSLIIIPILLLTKHYHIPKIGLYTALLGSIMSSYYYRTHLGYYDTDILNVFFPLLAIYFLVKLVDSKNIMYALFASITLIGFDFWYHSAEAIIISIIGIYLIYALLFEKTYVYAYQALFILVFTLLPLLFIYKF
ncbi:MAG: dolichyl-diphosphooligosaccharide--protein glycosyltransferase subunit STT3, partial [Epsilonproteobacteria bacterium]|nr:dolichyl-diphosphooligosaccharide--protein glycosyltransferase subunit STT3 [Campylobacterota bacterium]